MKARLLPLIALALPLWLSALPAQAASFENYLPMGQTEYRKKFRMQHLLTIPFPADFQSMPEQRFPQAGVSGVTLKLSKVEDDLDEWVLQGKDKTGHPWSLYTGQLAYPSDSAQIFQADLDRNGINDLIIWAPNHGAGMAPYSRLEIITFESNGRPVLLETWSYYSVGQHGIDDLLDLHGNGRAQLLTMHYSDGYWLTDLYQVDNARWRRVMGRFGQLSYPALTRFSYRPSRTLVKSVRADRHPVAPDMSNQHPWGRTIYRLADAEGNHLRGDGKTLTINPYFAALVVDQPGGRTILSSSANDQRRAAVWREFYTAARPLHLYGDPGLWNEPVVVWAAPR